jgi:transcription elongation GreA/GreB family factor
MPVDKLDWSRVNMRDGNPLCQTKAGGQPFTKVFIRVNKSSLRAAILMQLQSELTLQADAAQLARDEATSEESRAENKWDTHSQEAAYLAEGQAKLAAEIGTSIEVYTSLSLPDLGAGDVIVLGALIELEAGNKRSWYFLGPRAGGLELSVDGRDILVLTPLSPLGRQLIGKRVGDVVQSVGRGGPTVQRIVSIA